MSRGCHNRCSAAGSLRSRCQWGWFLLRPRENLVQAPSSFSALLASLAPWTCRRSPHLCPIFTWRLPGTCLSPNVLFLQGRQSYWIRAWPPAV